MGVGSTLAWRGLTEVQGPEDGDAILAVAVGFNEVQYSTLLKPQQQAKLDHDTRLCRGHMLLKAGLRGLTPRA
jgi:hypothetical protein